MDRLWDALARTRWPLLLIGLFVMTVATGLFRAGEDESEGRGIMLGVGAILLGAGLVRLVYDDVPRPTPPKDDEKEPEG